MPTTAQKVIDLLADVAGDTTKPSEMEFARHFFDPMHGLTELRYAAKRGFIHLLETGTAPERFRFQLTALGREAEQKWVAEQKPARIGSTNEKVRMLIDDLCFENPAPAEGWVVCGNFDPMHGLTEINAAKKGGWIEIDQTGGVKENWKIRLTPAGRQKHEKRLSRTRDSEPR